MLAFTERINLKQSARAASHGCIRTANWDAARVKELVTVGNIVSIFLSHGSPTALSSR